MAYALYVHIPYCHSRCLYCNFHTAACGGVPDAYIDALLRSFYAFAPKTAGGHTKKPVTVYFGGGTPSLLLPAQVRRLLAAFMPLPGAEVTLEANPESATEEKLEGWLEAGVNRLSFGVQTANDVSLKRLGRLHTAKQASEALRAAQQTGFSNISGDIMLALPGYTQQEFDDTLELLAGNGASHISAYLLKIEEGTPFAAKPLAALPSPEQAADFYLYAVQKLCGAGFEQYEISNFAKKGLEGRHNLMYWDCNDYLGLGPAAHSCLGGVRFSFAPATEAFIKEEAAPQPEGECTATDYIMLQLRLAKGLAVQKLQDLYNYTLSHSQLLFLQRLCDEGLAEKTKEGWKLTPGGMLVQNTILAQLL